ncbi:hypothetical protein [Reichenbachiella ulvae]|uniref:Lipocalin-like domain-containing protein n=1 Tax=Reichenbachiella ulvae TaxID=2980104 RepID=A0ABT3CPQ7_9BACT|nr:hypothetical protein [Reichenbachiella ulvae]MCV9385258.1 hypothetical protein [Reichenbachiella ulvae]
MNKYFNISILLLAILIVSSCSSSDSDGGSKALVETAAMLTKGEASAASVNVPGGSNVTDWTGFKITFTGDENGGTYTTNADTEKLQHGVWNTSGTWEFGDNEGLVLIRDGNVDMPISLEVSESNFSLVFEMASPLARTNVVGGEWAFNFIF